MISLKLKTAPSADPVSLAETKDYLRVDGSADDNAITVMIKAATLMLEEYCDAKFIEQVWLEYHDFWPYKNKNDWWDGVKEIAISELYQPMREMKFSLGPIVQFIGLKTYPDSGVPETFDPSNYVIDNSGYYGRLALVMGAVWPTTILRKINGIELEYKIGLANGPSTLPSNVKQAILITIARMYEKRGDENITIPALACSLLSSYRRFKL